jgi:hypothetical protein
VQSLTQRLSGDRSARFYPMLTVQLECLIQAIVDFVSMWLQIVRS